MALLNWCSLGDGITDFQLELTWLKDRTEPYDLGDEEFHLAFETDDYESCHKRHKEMGCICFENPGMGIYFIQDPDGILDRDCACEVGIIIPNQPLTIPSQDTSSIQGTPSILCGMPVGKPTSSLLHRQDTTPWDKS